MWVLGYQAGRDAALREQQQPAPPANVVPMQSWQRRRGSEDVERDA
jgi:hypothetical protein